MAMVRLRVLIAHQNEYGDRQQKAVADTYDAPEQAAQHLIAAQICEAAPTTPARGAKTKEA